MSSDARPDVEALLLRERDMPLYGRDPKISALCNWILTLETPYEPTCEVDRAKARDLALDSESMTDWGQRNLARAFRLEADARREAEGELAAHLEALRLQVKGERSATDDAHSSGYICGRNAMADDNELLRAALAAEHEAHMRHVPHSPSVCGICALLSKGGGDGKD